MSYAYCRLLAALCLMTMGQSCIYASVVVLTPSRLEFGVGQSEASLIYSVTFGGSALGAAVMGRWSDRVGVMWPAIAGGLCMPLGYFLAGHATALWQLLVVHALLLGFLGNATVFAPMIADVTHWFERNRGIAVAIVISGSYVAGAIWPPVLQHFIDAHGWRETYWGMAVFCFAVMLPLTQVMRRPTPAHHGGEGEAAARARTDRPLGMPAGMTQCLLCVAGVGCCIAMAVPQAHLVAYAIDLGHAAQHGANMMGLLFAGGIISRLVSGWISDHIGGLRTLIVGSALQALGLAFFLPFDGLVTLYVVSFLFGLSQGGIVPSYAIIVRTYFNPREAAERIGVVLTFTLAGMAVGGWLAGWLYDLSGSYELAFWNGIGFNILNLLIAGLLLARARRLAAPLLAGPSATP